MREKTTWEELQSSKWVGVTTRNNPLITLRYTIRWEEGQSPDSIGITCGHPYAIYIFDLAEEIYKDVKKNGGLLNKASKFRVHR